MVIVYPIISFSQQKNNKARKRKVEDVTINRQKYPEEVFGWPAAIEVIML